MLFSLFSFLPCVLLSWNLSHIYLYMLVRIWPLVCLMAAKNPTIWTAKTKLGYILDENRWVIVIRSLITFSRKAGVSFQTLVNTGKKTQEEARVHFTYFAFLLAIHSHCMSTVEYCLCLRSQQRVKILFCKNWRNSLDQVPRVEHTSDNNFRASSIVTKPSHNMIVYNLCNLCYYWYFSLNQLNFKIVFNLHCYGDINQAIVFPLYAFK